MRLFSKNFQFPALCILSILFVFSKSASAGDKISLPMPTASTTFQENKDGNIKEGEYEVMNESGSLTRRPCPYTCENRGIPRESCHEWRSVAGDLCYVHDTRLPQAAVPLDRK